MQHLYHKSSTISPGIFEIVTLGGLNEIEVLAINYVIMVYIHSKFSMVPLLAESTFQNLHCNFNVPIIH